MPPTDYTRGFKGGGGTRRLVRSVRTGLHGTTMPSYDDALKGRKDAAWRPAHFLMRQAGER